LAGLGRYRSQRSGHQPTPDKHRMQQPAPH
jgi:hypothetical protein